MIPVKQMIDELNDHYLTTAEIGRKIGYTNPDTLGEIQRGAANISKNKLEKLTVLYNKVVRPADARENNSRYDELERQLDAKLKTA